MSGCLNMKKNEENWKKSLFFELKAGNLFIYSKKVRIALKVFSTTCLEGNVEHSMTFLQRCTSAK